MKGGERGNTENKQNTDNKKPHIKARSVLKRFLSERKAKGFSDDL